VRLPKTLIAIAAFVACGTACGAAAHAQTPQPNIIYIVADDLGYGDLGCYGQEAIATPNLDRLARESMRFTDHYAGSTVCRPSRLVYLTGYHTGHTPISSNTGYVLKPGDVTVAELLKDAGYATGGVGKWALGGPGSTGHPNRQGFDFWYGYLDQGEAHNYYPEFLYRNETKERLPGNELGPRRVSVKRETYSHDLLTEEALAFIERNADKPFFLNVAYTIPHANNEGGRATGNGMEVPSYGMYADKDWPETEKGEAAMITRMDRDIGRMISLLKKLKIDDRTVVLFTSDNGPHSEGGHKHEYFDANGPLRGFKRDLYEGGIRVPLIAWWPGTVKPGQVSHHASAFWDLLPTACELAGVDAPQGIDGISFVPTLKGQQQPAHDYLFWKYGDNKTAIRQGRWKAVRPGPSKPLELYDLDEDIGEQHNLAADHADIVARLEKLIVQAQQSEPASDK